MKKFMKFLGFGENDANEYGSEYRRRRPSPSTTRDEPVRSNTYNGNYEDYDEEDYERTPLKNGLILFKGLPSMDNRLQLRDALLDGCIILLDLSGIAPERIEEGKQFLKFMEGVSFCNNGEILKLAPRLFSVSPRPGMVQTIIGTTSLSRKQGDEA